MSSTLLGKTLFVAVKTAKLIVASWAKDEKGKEKATYALSKEFLKVDLVAVLVLNLFAYNCMCFTLAKLAQFSSEFVSFFFLFSCIPSVLLSLVYYYYRYGSQVFKAFDPEQIKNWWHNFVISLGIASVPLLFTIALFVFQVKFCEPLLPKNLQASFSFPDSVWEGSFREQTYAFWVYGGFLLLTTPIHNRGYKMYMQAIALKTESPRDMQQTETFMEVLYHLGQANSLFQLWIPLIGILTHSGLRIHIIHVIFVSIEIALVNFTLNYKFVILHKLAHEIPSLFKLTHAEHHITKGIYPITAGTGLWEQFFMGGTLGFHWIAMLHVPYLTYQGLYLGLNNLVHNMLPIKSFMTWHVLHHIAAADLYTNIPTSEEKKVSITYRKYYEKLKEVSLFIRYEWASDLIAVFPMIIGGLVIHYGFNTGIIYALREIQWH